MQGVCKIYSAIPRYQSGEYVANEDCTAAQPCEYDLHFLSSGIGAILHFENVCPTDPLEARPAGCVDFTSCPRISLAWDAPRTCATEFCALPTCTALSEPSCEAREYTQKRCHGARCSLGFQPLLLAIVICGAVAWLMPQTFVLRRRPPLRCPACLKNKCDAMTPERRWRLQLGTLVACLVIVLIFFVWYLVTKSCCGSCPSEGESKWESQPWIMSTKGSVQLEDAATWQPDGSLRVQHCNGSLPFDPHCATSWSWSANALGRRQMLAEDVPQPLGVAAGDGADAYQQPRLEQNPLHRRLQEGTCHGYWGGGGTCSCTAETNDGASAGTSQQTWRVPGLPPNTCAGGADDCDDGSVCHWDIDAARVGFLIDYDSALLAAGNGGFTLDFAYIFMFFKDKVNVCRGTCPANPNSAKCSGEWWAGSGNGGSLQTNCLMWTSGCRETPDCVDPNDCDWNVDGEHQSVEIPYSSTAVDLQIQIKGNCETAQFANQNCDRTEVNCDPIWFLHSQCIQNTGGTCTAAGVSEIRGCNTATNCATDRDCQETHVDGTCECTPDPLDAASRGTKTRTWSRTAGQGRLHNGAECAHTDGQVETVDCNGATGCPGPTNCEGDWDLGDCICTPDSTDAATAGSRTRTYQVTQPAANGGTPCDCEGGDPCDGHVGTPATCVAAGCDGPTPCEGAWDPDPCQCTADPTDSPTAGTQTETYRITAPLTNNGDPCPHADLEQRDKAPPTCDTATDCPFDCVGRWGCWSDCSVGCGVGTQSRTFVVEAEAQNGGLACEEADGLVEQRPCNTHACDECSADLELCMLAPEARPVPSALAPLCCCWAPALAAALSLLPLLLAILWLLCNRPKEDVAPLAAPEKEEVTMWILMLLDPTGIRHAVEVMSSEWSIESIVTKATEATGIQPDDMVLKFGGRELQAGKKLTSYGVQHGSEIQIQAKAGHAVQTRQVRRAAARKELKAKSGRQSI